MTEPTRDATTGDTLAALIDTIEAAAKAAGGDQWESAWDVSDEATDWVIRTVGTTNAAGLVVGLLWSDGHHAACCREHARYIATMDPATSLRIVAALRRFETMVGVTRSARDELDALAGQYKRECERLRREIEAACLMESYGPAVFDHLRAALAENASADAPPDKHNPVIDQTPYEDTPAGKKTREDYDKLCAELDVAKTKVRYRRAASDALTRLGDWIKAQQERLSHSDTARAADGAYEAVLIELRTIRADVETLPFGEGEGVTADAPLPVGEVGAAKGDGTLADALERIEVDARRYHDTSDAKVSALERIAKQARAALNAHRAGVGGWLPAGEVPERGQQYWKHFPGENAGLRGKPHTEPYLVGEGDSDTWLRMHRWKPIPVPPPPADAPREPDPVRDEIPDDGGQIWTPGVTRDETDGEQKGGA